MLSSGKPNNPKSPFPPVPVERPSRRPSAAAWVLLTLLVVGALAGGGYYFSVRKPEQAKLPVANRVTGSPAPMLRIPSSAPALDPGFQHAMDLFNQAQMEEACDAFKLLDREKTGDTPTEAYLKVSCGSVKKLHQAEDDLFNQGVRLFNQGQYDDARQKFEQCGRIQGLRNSRYHDLALDYVRKIDNAMTKLHAEADANKNFAEGMRQFNARNYPSARDAFNKVVRAGGTKAKEAQDYLRKIEQAQPGTTKKREAAEAAPMKPTERPQSAGPAAQNAVVTGYVYDQTGFAVSGATMRLINAGTGFNRVRTTDADGSFTFSNVPPAVGYLVSAEMKGFSPEIRIDMHIYAGEVRVIQPPFLLQPLLEGEINIVTTPPGFEVLIDGRSYGPSPVRATLAPGEHTYALRRSGTELFVRTFAIRSGQILAKVVDLGGLVGPSTGHREHLTTTSEPRDDHVTETGPRKGSITAVKGNEVVLDLGSAAGIEKGTKLAFYKVNDPNTQVGVLEVIQVIDANHSRARIVYVLAGVRPAPSDLVRTQ